VLNKLLWAIIDGAGLVAAGDSTSLEGAGLRPSIIVRTRARIAFTASAQDGVNACCLHAVVSLDRWKGGEMRSPRRTVLLGTVALAMTAGSGAAIAAVHNSAPVKPTTTASATKSSTTATTTTPSTTTPSTTSPKSSTPSQSSTDKCPHSAANGSNTAY
jgi:hypothetical protein